MGGRSSEEHLGASASHLELGHTVSQIRGMFPGGPVRPGDANQEGDGAETRLRSGEDVEARIAGGQGELKTRWRRRSKLIAIAVVVVVAGVAGVYVGLQAIVTPEELTERARMEEEASELGDIVDDVMGELWRMEDIEAARDRR